MHQNHFCFPPKLAREPKEVEQSLVRHCKSALAALRLCIQLSGYSYEFIALALGEDKGRLSRVMNGSKGANFPVNKIDDLEYLCGNMAFTQFCAWKKKRRLTDYQMSIEEENEYLKEQLSQFNNAKSA